MEITIGHGISINGQTFQNYDLGGGGFLPFAFTGAVINRNGDNITASLIFPGNDLARSWAVEAAKDQWIVEVAVYANSNELYRYVGQVSGASWDEQAVKLELSTVLDAVGADVPFRTLSSDLVGPLPTSAGVRVF